jgi:tRNA pseudouridine55 synthase
MEGKVPSGILVIDKPRGPTSHDVVARLRRALEVRAVGHAGTLDPMATGVLVVAVGEATKLVSWLTAQDKAYQATIALGVETDTLDADGREVRHAAPSEELRDALARSNGSEVAPMLRTAFERELSRTSQVPPAYSAIKTRGERGFARARRGEAPPLAPREVRLQRIELVTCCADPPWLAIAIETSKGYYVRALARDLAEALGTVGHLTSLRRTRSGTFVVEEAIAFDSPPDEMRARIEPLAQGAARVLPIARLNEAGAVDAKHGRRVSPLDIEAPTRGPCAWLDPRGELAAIGEIDDEGRGKVLRGFGGETTRWQAAEKGEGEPPRRKGAKI